MREDIVYTYRRSNFSSLVQSVLVEKLSRINILNPVVTEQNFSAIMSLPSLLGLDILSRFQVSLDANFVTLEK
jgi:hypothetical protein